MSLTQKPPKSVGKPSGKTIIEQVYATLRTDILNGQLTPGSRLRVEELRARFGGIGASTVREALSRLLVENLATTEGQRGFRVAEVSLADFQDIAAMRKLLETQAVRESVIRGDDDWEARVVTAAHHLSKIETSMKDRQEVPMEDWEARNSAFHDALVSACTNRWLINFRRVLYQHSIRYLRISLVERTIPRDVGAEHRAILEAAMDRNADLTSQLTSEHIERSVMVLKAKVADVVA
ncbi:Transcriptional regulator, GntR family [Magnetospira sp. QH-2]|nr:Transcriptional regulator, GntR family [Magnetospira sp. QH-2]